MYRSLSRILLENRAVQPERLQNITPQDCLAEGIIVSTFEGKPQMQDALPQFIYLWDSINAKRGYPFDSNPWVWAIKFAMVEASSLDKF